MKFEEIFKQKGLYKADGFAKGVAFEVSEDGTLYIVSYKNENDTLPEKATAVVYGGLFQKDFEVVYTRQSLFL